MPTTNRPASVAPHVAIELLVGCHVDGAAGDDVGLHGFVGRVRHEAPSRRHVTDRAGLTRTDLEAGSGERVGQLVARRLDDGERQHHAVGPSQQHKVLVGDLFGPSRWHLHHERHGEPVRRVAPSGDGHRVRRHRCTRQRRAAARRRGRTGPRGRTVVGRFDWRGSRPSCHRFAVCVVSYSSPSCGAAVIWCCVTGSAICASARRTGTTTSTCSSSRSVTARTRCARCTSTARLRGQQGGQSGADGDRRGAVRRPGH